MLIRAARPRPRATTPPGRGAARAVGGAGRPPCRRPPPPPSTRAARGRGGAAPHSLYGEGYPLDGGGREGGRRRPCGQVPARRAAGVGRLAEVQGAAQEGGDRPRPRSAPSPAVARRDRRVGSHRREGVLAAFGGAALERRVRGGEMGWGTVVLITGQAQGRVGVDARNGFFQESKKKAAGCHQHPPDAASAPSLTCTWARRCAGCPQPGHPPSLYAPPRPPPGRPEGHPPAGKSE